MIEEINQEEQLTTSTRKLTVGFKCDASLKQKLSKVSSELGFTVSEFIESLLGDFTDLDGYITKNQSDADKNRELTTQLDILQTKLAFYECPKLESFFKRCRGKEFNFFDYDGNQIHIEVNRLQDVFTLMISSFKISDNL